MAFDKEDILYLGGAMYALKAAISEGFGFTDKAQKASLSLGMTLGQARDRLGSSLDGLRGSIDQRLTAGLLTLEEGLRGNQAGVSKLINQQQLTGTSFQNTSKVMAKVNAVLGLNNEAVQKLSEDVIESGNKYGVATDYLVGAIDKLTPQFANFRALGLQNLPAAFAELTASLPKGMESSLQAIAGQIFKVGEEGVALRARLGLQGLFTELQANKGSVSALTQILEEAFVSAGTRFTDLAGGAEMTDITLGAMSESIAGIGPELAAVAEQLAMGGQVFNDTSVSFADTIATQLSEVWNPLKEAVMNLYVVAFPLVSMAAKILTSAVTYLTDQFKKAYVSAGGLKGIQEKITDAFKVMQPYLIVIGTIALVAVTKALFAMLLPLTPLIATVVVLGGLLKIMGVDFKVLKDKIVDLVNNPLYYLKLAFIKMQSVLGSVIAKIGSWVSDSMEKAGNNMVAAAKAGEAALDLAKAMKESAEAKTSKPEQTQAELDLAFNNLLQQDAEHFSLMNDNMEETKRNTAKIEENTRPDTTSAFMDETMLTLQESVDSILGISPRDSIGLFEDMRDLMEQNVAISEEMATRGSMQPAQGS